MSARWARTTLSAYRVLGAGIYPFAGAWMWWRTRKGKEDRARRNERYGLAGKPRPRGPLIWAHATGAEDTQAMLPLITEYARLELSVVLTTGTMSAARIAEGAIAAAGLDQHITHQFSPLDLQPAISRFLDHWRPDLAVIAGPEIWPMTILELGARRIPQVLINARLSERSFKSWKKRLSLSEALFEKLAHVVAQSETDAQRFAALGGRPVTVSGNLRADLAQVPDDDEAYAAFSAAMGTRPRWAALGTMQGEDIIAAHVHMALKPRFAGLLTLIAPADAARVPSIVAMLEAKGLSHGIVSSMADVQAVASEPDLIIVTGDLAKSVLPRLSGIAFLGNSITGGGGTAPYDAAAAGNALLFGRNMQGHQDVARRLVEQRGARMVDDAKALAVSVRDLLVDPAQAQDMATQAMAMMVRMRGALALTRGVLEPYVGPLLVKKGLAPHMRDALPQGRRNAGRTDES